MVHSNRSCENEEGRRGGEGRREGERRREEGERGKLFHLKVVNPLLCFFDKINIYGTEKHKLPQG